LTRIVHTVSKGTPLLKSMDRLTASVKLVGNLLGIPDPTPTGVVRACVADALGPYLNHRFPRIRAVASEHIYLVLSEDEVEEKLESVLLETEWLGDGEREGEGEGAGTADAAQRVVRLLKV
jgi:hypothetical protein